jgi:hypothetical protein
VNSQHRAAEGGRSSHQSNRGSDFEMKEVVQKLLNDEGLREEMRR